MIKVYTSTQKKELTAFKYVFYLKLPVPSNIFPKTELLRSLREHTKPKPKLGFCTVPKKLTAQGKTPPLFLSLN